MDDETKSKNIKNLYNKISNLTIGSGVSRGEIITILETLKLDIMLNEGMIILDGKVGMIQK